MCSLQDSEFPVAVSAQPQSSVPSSSTVNVAGRTIRDRPCAKCKTATPVVIIRHDGFCSECFQRNVGSKFRTVIGKLRTPVEDAGGKATILLAYSGGPASRVLLQLANDYNTATRSQRFTTYTICHVDESALFEKDERMKTAASKFINDLRKIAAEFPFEYEQVPLESVFSLGNDDDSAAATIFMMPMRHDASSIFAESFDAIRQNTALSNAQKLQCLFEKAESLSAREDLLFYLRQQVLRLVAIRRNCAAIWMADTATRVAIRTISNVAKGRGLALSLETGAQSDIQDGVAFWRPIRDVLAKEIGLYVHYQRLSMPSFPALLHTRRSAKSSIGRLSEEFITGLEKEFASTANTVTRTVGKLMPSSNVDYGRRCALCQMPADQDSVSWLALCTVTTMKRLRAALPDTHRLPINIKDLTTTSTYQKCCGNDSVDTSDACCAGNNCSSTNREKQTKFDLMPALCYGCLITLRDFPVITQSTNDSQHAIDDIISTASENVIPLPAYVEQSARQQLDQKALYDKIADFLIDDDDD